MLTNSIMTLKPKDPKAAQTELKSLERSMGKSDGDVLLLDAARTLDATSDFKLGPSPDAATGKMCLLSESKWSNAKVGLGATSCQRLPNDTVTLHIGGRLFARGMYAHAPNTYKYDLGGKWNRLTGGAGLADVHEWSVFFDIHGGRQGIVTLKENRRR